jgi:hypothetical protein
VSNSGCHLCTHASYEFFFNKSLRLCGQKYFWSYYSLLLVTPVSWNFQVRVMCRMSMSARMSGGNGA